MNGRVINIDARPSDALNLAVRTNVPILVSRKVMEEAGILPDEDLAEETEELEGEPEETQERLEIFEDFLDTLELDEEDDEDEDQE